MKSYISHFYPELVYRVKKRCSSKNFYNNDTKNSWLPDEGARYLTRWRWCIFQPDTVYIIMIIQLNARSSRFYLRHFLSYGWVLISSSSRLFLGWIHVNNYPADFNESAQLFLYVVWEISDFYKLLCPSANVSWILLQLQLHSYITHTEDKWSLLLHASR